MVVVVSLENAPVLDYVSSVYDLNGIYAIKAVIDDTGDWAILGLYQGIR